MDSKEHKKETIQNSITKSEFKKYVDFIHDDSIPLPEHERTYLKNLLKNGEIEEFKDQYRRHLQNLDRVGFSDEDIELQLNVLKKIIMNSETYYVFIQLAYLICKKATPHYH